MNRFVYLVHADYRDGAQPSSTMLRGVLQHPSEKVARVRAGLRRYLPDIHVRVSGEPIRRNPDVIQITVVTTLDEASADAAFVRFIRDSNAALLPERAGNTLDAVRSCAHD